MRKQTAKQRKRHARNRRMRQAVPRGPAQAARPKTRQLLRALAESVFPIVSEAYGSPHCCVPANQIASAVLADDYGIKSKSWVCKLWAHNETYRRLLAKNYPDAPSPFFPPEIDAWEEQGAFIHMCTDVHIKPVEGVPAAFIQCGVPEEDGFPYHVLLECGGFLADLALQQFKTGDIELENPTMRKDGAEYFKLELPSGVRVIYRRVHGVDVPLLYSDGFAEAKAKVSEALRHQLRWDKQVGRPLVEAQA